MLATYEILDCSVYDLFIEAWLLYEFLREN